MNDTNKLEHQPESEDKLAFQPFPKLARLNREIIITEKLDGTNAQLLIDETGKNMLVGSRNRYLTLNNDNYGFARWCNANFEDLLRLGPGRHFGEWWGNGIQRGYGLKEKRFSLFNVQRWGPDGHGGVYQRVKDDVTGESRTVPGPSCCRVVPILWRGPMHTGAIEEMVRGLSINGSVAAPGFMDPEGIVVFHTAANSCFKVTLKNDESPKSLLTCPSGK